MAQGPSEAGQLPKPAVPLHKMLWYHGAISRPTAEERLNPRQNGLYLVRDGSGAHEAHVYTLSLCWENQVEHYSIRVNNDCLTIDDEQLFGSLRQLVEHYQREADGLCTRLLVPLENRANLRCEVEMEDFGKFGWTILKEKVVVHSLLDESEGLLTESFKGEYMGKNVGIKRLKDDFKGLEDFLAEAAIMTSLNHPNLVELIGVSVDARPVCMVTEFMELGSLRIYLLTRPMQKDTLVDIACDICGGMAYLEQKRLVHRHLTATNILLSGEKVAKVSNFRLTRELDYDLGDREFPACWAPPEVLEAKVFSNKSDVWSFGVVLWEIYSFGREPYSDQVVEHTMQNILSYLKEGGRLECPLNCPPKVYDIMRSCWCEKPEDRPTFSELQDVLKSLSSADEGNINRAELKFGPALKDEEFAEVFSGEYRKEKVTIKSLKDQRNKEWLLATDVSLMTSLNHPHLVKLLGVSKEEKSVLVVTEVMDKGCLLEHVQTNQALFERSHLARFARDICCAMAYLEQKDLVHTNLAARNIVMSGESIKVSKVEYAVRSGKKLDVLTDAMRWTAPEALESGVFSNKSDVWSFGMVLWEMYSFGLDPYPGMSKKEVLTFIREGGMMKCPEHCTPELCDIMKSCWCKGPKDRPTFLDLKELLVTLVM